MGYVDVNIYKKIAVLRVKLVLKLYIMNGMNGVPSEKRKGADIKIAFSHRDWGKINDKAGVLEMYLGMTY